MKKILTIATAAALTAVGSMAIEWGSLENLAQGAAVTVSSKQADAATITDGQDGTSWQAIPSTHNVTVDWALIDLGDVKEFNTIEIKWEASHPSKYSVYVSEEAIPFEVKEANVNTEENPLMIECGFVDAEWLASATAFSTREIEGEAAYDDNITKQGKGRYILVYADEYNGFSRQYGSRIFEVRVADIHGMDNVTDLKVSEASVLEGKSADVTVTAVNVLGETMDIASVENLALACSAPDAVEISGGDNGVFTVKGLKSGVYTLTATGTADGHDVKGSASFSVMMDWSGIENIATGKEISGRFIPADEIEHPVTMAVDGDEETYYEYNGEWGGGDAWLLVDLGKEYMVEAIGVSFGEHSNGNTKVGYALDITASEEYLKNTQFKWDNDNVPAGWTFTPSFDRTSNSVATHVYAAPVKARYIAVRDTDNPGGKPQVKEIYVKGEEYQQPYAASLKVTAEPAGLFAGETAQVSCSVLDQYGDIFEMDGTPEISVNGAAYADGVITAGDKGLVEISATLGSMSATTSIMVADMEDYCMAGATVTSDESKSMGPEATDGGKDPKNHGGLYIVTENESQGEHEHWILADLHKEYTLDMIIAIWEGACPADYDVYVGSTEDTLEKLYSVVGHTQNTWYDRFSGKEMKGVRYIKIVTTKNATGYGIKLFDLKAYGTSDMASVATEITLEADGDNISTDETVSLTASVLDQFGGRMEADGLKYIVSSDASISADGKFKAEKAGNYEIYAKFGDLESAPVYINVVADAASKLAGAACESTTINGVDAEKNPLAGDELHPGLDEAVEIVFDKAYDLTLIKLRWEAACPSDYTVIAHDGSGNTREILRVEGRSFVGGFNPVDRIVHNVATTNEMMSRANAMNSTSLSGVKKLTITATGKDHGYNLRLFGIDAYGSESGTTSSISGIMNGDENAPVDVYSVSGALIRSNVEPSRALDGLAKGVYIVGGKKVVK